MDDLIPDLTDIDLTDIEPEIPDVPAGLTRVGDLVGTVELHDEPRLRLVARDGDAVEIEIMDRPGTQALVQQRDTLLAQASALKVVDVPTYTLAAELAVVFGSLLKDAHAHFDPDIESANKLHKSLIAKRNTVTDPLDAALASMKQRASAWHAERERERIEATRKAEHEASINRRDELAALEASRIAATNAGDMEQARAIVEEAREVAMAPPPPPVQSEVPKVKGFTPSRPNWIAEVVDKRALVDAVAGRDRMLAIVDEWIEGREGSEADVDEHACLSALRVELQRATPSVSIEAVEANMTYLRQRAVADKDDLKIPGVRPFNKAGAAVRS